eukprot:664558_1
MLTVIKHLWLAIYIYQNGINHWQAVTVIRKQKLFIVQTQLNKAAAEYALPKVIQLMASVHGWSSRDCVMHYHNTMEFLRTMHVEDSRRWGRSRHTLGDARRVVETTLDGISMTDEAMQFVMDRFQHYYSSTGNELERCIARAHCLELAKEFSAKFGDDRSCVIDALMFTQQKQLGLYEILVLCAACAGH